MNTKRVSRDAVKARTLRAERSKRAVAKEARARDDERRARTRVCPACLSTVFNGAIVVPRFTNEGAIVAFYHASCVSGR